MSSEQVEPVWLFDFALESENGAPVPSSTPEELLDVIIDWVEQRGLQIGGGYRPPRPEELEPGPIYQSDSEAEAEPVDDETVNPRVTS